MSLTCRLRLPAAQAWPSRKRAKWSRDRSPPAPPAPWLEVLFETGYGPPLPHIGTFGEVARTSWVRQASRRYRTPTRLVAFSDDMDGLRKVS
jgi:lysyl-tRNA synthetase class 1